MFIEDEPLAVPERLDGALGPPLTRVNNNDRFRYRHPGKDEAWMLGGQVFGPGAPAFLAGLLFRRDELSSRQAEFGRLLCASLHKIPAGVHTAPAGASFYGLMNAEPDCPLSSLSYMG